MELTYLLPHPTIASAPSAIASGRHRPNPPSSLMTHQTHPFACHHLPTQQRSRHCRPPHLHHLLLAVIFAAIAPPPAFARQHCRRRHHCLLLLPPPTLIALSTARFLCSQHDAIAVAVIAATFTSSPNDNVQHRDRNGWRRRNGRRDGGNGYPLSQPPPRIPHLSRAPSHLPPNVDCHVLPPPPTAARRRQHPDIVIAPPMRHRPTTAPLR
jgi:hypothetical protein